jgi:hypothetical protein
VNHSDLKDENIYSATVTTYHIWLVRDESMQHMLCRIDRIKRRHDYEVLAHSLAEPTCDTCIARWAILTANFGAYKYYSTAKLKSMLQIIEVHTPKEHAPWERKLDGRRK